MGAKATLPVKEYKIQTETDTHVVATKGEEKFFIQKENDPDLISTIETLKTTKHPHIVGFDNSFTDETTYYIVMNYCEGGSLASKITEMSENPAESEVLSWFAEICLALKAIHEKDLLHKQLTPQKTLLTEFGTVCLGRFGKTPKVLKKNHGSGLETTRYMAPEVFTQEDYNDKSDIWSLGCVLYELCTREQAFSADSGVKLKKQITRDPAPSLPRELFSAELQELLSDMLNKDPQSRPTASQILECGILLKCLYKKCKTTVEDLQTKNEKLKEVAEGLERVHEGTTIGSLAGGVVGAVGGVTSIVGLILAPFTLGASLIVTGVGVGVGVLGGVTAGASNITNMVNQASDRRAVRTIIKEFEEKTSAVITWLQEIGKALETLRSRCDSANKSVGEDSQFNESSMAKLGFRAGRGIGGIAELLRLVQVMNIGRIAAQASRLVRVAEVATGVFSGLFVAVDIFFIAMDAREIHRIRQAKGGKAEAQGQVRSEIIKFVQSIRQASEDFQKILDELKNIIKSIDILGDESQQRDMELPE